MAGALGAHLAAPGTEGVGKAMPGRGGVTPPAPQSIASALMKLDAWLDTMYHHGGDGGGRGYGGPVAHWWQDCLHFAGAGLDWRYEGILLGYLALHQKTGDGQWLAKAHRAGDDLVQGQLSTGNYRNSSFELNPYSGGTPHEAACDLALLQLSRVLQKQGDPAWQEFLAAAETNLRAYYVGQLWDAEAHSFRDHPEMPSFVPNKAATLAEALLALADLTGEEAWIERYARPTLDTILLHQVRTGVLRGAIHQYSLHGQPVDCFFPYYTARCVPGLVAGYAHCGDECYLDAAQSALAFVLSCRFDDGSFPQVIYPRTSRTLSVESRRGRLNRYPVWIAATGDVLRATALLAPYGVQADPQPTMDWLLRGQQPTGAFSTAWGFASQASQQAPGPLPEFRDVLPACGWNDKAFRYLTDLIGEESLPEVHDLGTSEQPCLFRGLEAVYREDRLLIEVHRGRDILYRWRKGDVWAQVAAPMSRLR
jgi:hypothetical protein